MHKTHPGLTRPRFAYSVGFAALVAASAAELELWLGGRGADKPVDGVVVYTIVPLAMICINLVKVKVRQQLAVVPIVRRRSIHTYLMLT